MIGIIRGTRHRSGSSALDALWQRVLLSDAGKIGLVVRIGNLSTGIFRFWHVPAEVW